MDKSIDLDLGYWGHKFVQAVSGTSNTVSIARKNFVQPISAQRFNFHSFKRWTNI